MRSDYLGYSGVFSQKYVLNGVVTSRRWRPLFCLRLTECRVVTLPFFKNRLFRHRLYLTTISTSQETSQEWKKNEYKKRVVRIGGWLDRETGWPSVVSIFPVSVTGSGQINWKDSKGGSEVDTETLLVN